MEGRFFAAAEVEDSEGEIVWELPAGCGGSPAVVLVAGAELSPLATGGGAATGAEPAGSIDPAPASAGLGEEFFGVAAEAPFFARVFNQFGAEIPAATSIRTTIRAPSPM